MNKSTKLNYMTTFFNNINKSFFKINLQITKISSNFTASNYRWDSSLKKARKSVIERLLRIPKLIRLK